MQTMPGMSVDWFYQRLYITEVKASSNRIAVQLVSTNKKSESGAFYNESALWKAEDVPEMLVDADRGPRSCNEMLLTGR